MDEPNNGPSASADDEGPVLKLNAKELLEFVSKHTDADRTSFDRLLKWFGVAATGLIAIAGFFGYQSKRDVDATAAAVREEAKTQIQAEVAKETNEQNIQKYISAAIEKRTEAQFQDAIAKAVAAQLETPERQKFLQTAVQQQVDIWFAKHQNVLQAAAQQQVDALTKRFQEREMIFNLEDKAKTPSPDSGPALTQLRTMYNASSDEHLKLAAGVAIDTVAQYWSNTSYLLGSYQIKNQATLTACDLLGLLKSSPSWETRARSADLLTRQEKGVPEALMNAMLGDDYVDVRVHAAKAFSIVTNKSGDLATFPDPQSFREWWAKQGPSITAKLKPLDCK